jgi:hypothetical protein
MGETKLVESASIIGMNMGITNSASMTSPNTNDLPLDFSCIAKNN